MTKQEEVQKYNNKTTNLEESQDTFGNNLEFQKSTETPDPTTSKNKHFKPENRNIFLQVEEEIGGGAKTSTTTATNNNIINNINKKNNTGEGDLNPFGGSNLNIPSMASNPYTPQFGGNLVGPNHPLFHPQYNNNNNNNNENFYNDDPNYNYFNDNNNNTNNNNYYDPNSFFPPLIGGDPRNRGNNSVFPVPRFDPIMPDPGPNGPDFGVDFGGRSGGRGGGRNKLFRGEPNPDHMKPPGW
jgi:hypothetical protein